MVSKQMHKRVTTPTPTTPVVAKLLIDADKNDVVESLHRNKLLDLHFGCRRRLFIPLFREQGLICLVTFEAKEKAFTTITSSDADTTHTHTR